MADKTEQIRIEHKDGEKTIIKLRNLGKLDLEPGDILCVQPQRVLNIDQFGQVRKAIDHLRQQTGKQFITWYIPHDVDLSVIRPAYGHKRIIEVADGANAANLRKDN